MSFSPDTFSEQSACKLESTAPNKKNLFQLFESRGKQKKVLHMLSEIFQKKFHKGIESASLHAFVSPHDIGFCQLKIGQGCLDCYSRFLWAYFNIHECIGR